MLEHVGVNAPGKANTTTFLPLNKSSVVTSCQLPNTLVLNVHYAYLNAAFILDVNVNVNAHVEVNADSVHVHVNAGKSIINVHYIKQ